MTAEEEWEQEVNWLNQTLQEIHDKNNIELEKLIWKKTILDKEIESKYGFFIY
jgi:hypothetical protein